MNISKQLGIGVIIGFLIGVMLLFAFTQYSSPVSLITTKDNQIAALENQITTKDSQINSLQTQVSDLQNRLNTLENYISVYNETSTYIADQTWSGQPIEKVAVQGVSVSGNGLLVVAQSTFQKDVTIQYAVVKDSAGNVIASDNSLSTVLPKSGTLTTITISLTGGALSSGHAYTVTLVSASLNAFISPTFVAP